MALTRRFLLISLIVATADTCCRPRNDYSEIGIGYPSFGSSCGHTRYYHATDTPGGFGVVGGMDGLENEFPWLVGLRDENDTFFCAASIIDEKWLLTSAYCLESASRITAHFSDHTLSSLEYQEYTMEVVMSESLVHDYYDVTTLDYDFALLKLPYALDFNQWNVQKICLPYDCYDQCSEHNQLAFIHGWGYQAENGSLSDIMQSGLVYIKDRGICEDDYTGLATITDSMLCAGVYMGGVDTCNGDSGGPLAIVEDGYFKLCGVASFGMGCGRAEYPGVYARVCQALPWIRYWIG